MKIRLLTPLAGHAYSHRPGTIIDVDDAEGHRHVKNGNGTYLDPVPTVPAPVSFPVETAAVDTAPTPPIVPAESPAPVAPAPAKPEVADAPTATGRNRPTAK